ncbi:rhodanese-like domain-containing protein [Brunnivagina elsteri]|uniref:Rhodanese n=1 Tax=Brunnivagina elsteri CCALA 953 TaxID=987040 RepID=A0A2A2TNK2_9CYAN|nr:rhodanese-like domain-containing protein [Calothrix elsteri]PAX59934.1 rhodanese [Calothrix elsteri CCALA 953]
MSIFSKFIPTSKFIPIPKPIEDKSSITSLKERLDWGEPALTIVDVRDLNTFNATHITGAVSMPMNKLVACAIANLELIRDIYVYGETNEQTTEAAFNLREAGYENVAELLNGLAAWKAMGYPTEGFSAALT